MCFANTGRSAFNDQVVGRIARVLGAPTAQVNLVEVPAELIAINPGAMCHIAPGLAHGSRVVHDCTEGLWFRFVDLPENRPRLALLALLLIVYSFMKTVHCCSDRRCPI